MSRSASTLLACLVFLSLVAGHAAGQVTAQAATPLRRPLPPVLIGWGDITAVIAGTGLSGGGFSGDVILSHAADASVIPSAHHVKTVDATELTTGTLSEARLPQESIDGSEIEDGSLTGADIATASIPASDLIQGEGSGLNADLLDGLEASSFQLAAGDTSGNFGFLTDYAGLGLPAMAYAWNADTQLFVPQTVLWSNGPLHMRMSEGNIAVRTRSHMYAWSAVSGLWTEQSFSGDGSGPGLVGSGGNFAHATSTNIYAWSSKTQTWTSVSTGGNYGSVYPCDGNFGATSPGQAYAWSAATQTWFNQPISGVGGASSASGKSFGVLTSTNAYVWNSETEVWSSFGVSGIPLQIVGSP